MLLISQAPEEKIQDVRNTVNQYVQTKSKELAVLMFSQ